MSRTFKTPLVHLVATVARRLARLPADHWARRFFPRRAFTNRVIQILRPPGGVVTVAGHTMELDPLDSLRLSVRPTYEPLETAILDREILPGEIVADVGAHIGYYTLLFAKRVGLHGRVFAFEPDPENFAILTRNVKRNAYRNVVPVQLAVSDKSGPMRLYRSRINTGDQRLYDSGDDRLAVDVQATRLDDYFAEQRALPAVIKMDVQGAEALAVDGMHTLLSAPTTRLLVIEFWPGGLRRAGTEPAVFLRRLAAYGFNLHEIQESSQTLQPVTVETLLRLYSAEDRAQTNLLWVRGALRVYGTTT